MMQLVPVDAGNSLPARLRAKAGKVTNAFAAAVGGGFKVLSIKSKVFTIVEGDQKTLLTKPGEDDTPASNLQVVILAANPHKSKVYYKVGYSEGATEKPTCYSNNGISPEADAEEPQAKKCAACPHNVFGSKITENGKKAKACSDSMRIAVAAPDRLDDPMLLRVPATTLPILGSYGAELAARGADPHDVVTRIGFDYTVSHPALTFKNAGFIPDDFIPAVTEARDNPVVAQIIGIVPVEANEPAEQFETPKIEAPKEAAPKAASKAAAKPAPVVADDDDLPKAPKVKVKVEAPAAPVLAEVVDELDSLDFDD